MLNRELQQKTALVSAQLQICLLDEVIECLLGWLAPLRSGSNDRKLNWPLKTKDKLIPRRAIVRLSASAN
jgi:hypothetical protein